MASQNEIPENASTLKEKGNQSVKTGNYKEAALLYTHAIKLEPNNELLYSNRSLAYFKLQYYDLALKDADEVIRIKPEWAKGYFRRAEVEFANGLLDSALESYKKSLQYLPNDPGIIEAMLKINSAQKKNTESKEKLPWLSSCIGLILGITLTILDYTVTERPTLTNPILQVVFILVISGTFWLVAHVLISPYPHKTFEEGSEKQPRFYLLIGLVLGGSIVVIDATTYELLGLKSSSSRTLFTLIFAAVGWGIGIFLRNKRNRNVDEPFEETIQEETVEENHVPEKPSNKYTKAQARYRYKKGKML